MFLVCTGQIVNQRQVVLLLRWSISQFSQGIDRKGGKKETRLYICSGFQWYTLQANHAVRSNFIHLSLSWMPFPFFFSLLSPFIQAKIHGLLLQRFSFLQYSGLETSFYYLIHIAQQYALSKLSPYLIYFSIYFKFLTFKVCFMSHH